MLKSLRELRIDKGITVVELARLANVSRYTVWRAEQGNKISDVSKSRLAQILEVDRGDI